MRKPIVAGNWKMHGTKKTVHELLQQLKNAVDQESFFAEIAVFPPFVFLDQTEQLLSHTQIYWGAQNISDQTDGALTGEISASMLKDFHCQYVLIGHSERRHLLGETNEIIAKKFITAGKFGLKPVLCVGETKEERESGKTNEIIAQQLDAVLKQNNALDLFHRAVIAYEPVWAIGTGISATPLQAQEVHETIRQYFAKIETALGDELRILYGGSVKASNAADLFAMPDIDGGLIGGASLDPREFLDIIRLCNNFY